ncbi:hypothetical protein DIT71_08235 [Marinobacter vulgaris]|uniref:Uncharacterized protein n=1 Tax=Marinobacter vulgaris TaxID=1928331 RepID=A0A2V3ZP86_9GAMM|nr:hypothetical protein [Marinobacter vulgaris]PXX91833.1 hypothetical protein DIT71_08235 [Marinobacter vulgaris]TSJ70659.1 hypothetical protein FPC41_07135 [Marinobacter vulgaris]
MAARIFDQTLFRGQGALITLGSLLGGHAAANPDKFPDLKDFGSRAVSIFLRWQVNPEIGLPSEPFKVWRRPATPLTKDTDIAWSLIPLPPLGTVVAFEEPMLSVSGVVSAGATAQNVIVLPLADGVGFENVLGVLTFNLSANSSRPFTFQAPYITGLLLSGTSSLQSLTGIPMSAANQIKDWELVETVGFPVDAGQWNDLPGQSHGVGQGLVGAELSAKAAAANRYGRGVNPWGWHPQLPSGQVAPTWDLPSAAELITEAEAELLPLLHEALAMPPEDQASFTRDFVIHPPENASGNTMSGQDGKATVAPLTLLQLAASTDPLLAVTLGFGTGYAYEDIPTVNLGATSLFGDSNTSDWDYMVTGRWANGLDGDSDEVEYAALIPRPRKVTPAPAPADLQLDSLGVHQPSAADQPWTAAVRLSWERFVLDNLASVASFAVARSDLAVAGPARALMEMRGHAPGHMPIGDLTNPEDPERVRQSATDSAFPIPNNPGSVQARYGVATQNIFGIWSPWVTHHYSGNQPEPDLVQLVDANLVPVDPGPPASSCPATLRLDFVLDWRVRRVKSVRFRGRLFAAANRHQSPPGTFPAGVQTSLAGALNNVAVSFSGDAPTGVGGSVICLDAQGENEVAPGQATQGSSRRYRMTIPGFALDYSATRHIGLALQGQQTEVIAPGRTSAWTPNSKVCYASDPRARNTTVTPMVPLASLADANGESHARLDWASQPAAEGYAIYTSNEFTLLDRTGQSHPAPGSTLSQRLVALKAAFNADNDRNVFTRINDELFPGTSMDVTLPRGSQAIHCWIVLPVSAGGAEAPWPAGADAADALIVYAAPKVAEPAPPRIEVRRVAAGPGFAARLRIETRGTSGAHPRRIDLYRTRVADAARQLDSMGFPVAQISTSTADWTVSPPSPAANEWIDSVEGTDTPEGSWKYVWYRAVAWADPIPEKGILGGRSLASPAIPVVVPPPGPPPLGPLVASWPGGSPGDVLITFATPVPQSPGPLGVHVLQVEVVEKGVAEPLVRQSTPLQDVSDAAPGGTASGVWHAANGEFRLLIRRTDINHPVSVTVRLVDPINRSTEQTFNLAAGSILPVPTLSPIKSFTISARGKVYTFTIDGALDDAVGGEYYRLSLTLQKEPSPGPGSFIPMPGRPGIPRIPGRFTPVPGPVVLPGTERRGTQFTEHGDTLSYSSRLADVPTIAPEETFTVTRRRIGQRVTITITARAKLRSISATVTSPDGTTVTRRARG